MSRPDRIQPRLTDLQDAEIARYRAVSVPAVVGLILGLLAPLAMLDPLLWIEPPLGVLVGALALWQVSQHTPVLLGRKAAVVGLTLSLFFATAAPTNWMVFRYLVRREARQFAGYWFEYLAHDQPHKAYQLTVHPTYRRPLDEDPRELLSDDPRWQTNLEDYVSEPLVRALLALGEKAQVRYYDSKGQKHNSERDLLSQAFAVTYHEAGERKTFFVGVELERVKLPGGRACWYVSAANDGFVPDRLR